MTPKQTREHIKLVLTKLTPANHNLFKRMYSPFDLEKDINLVVDEIPNENLKYALSQVNLTYGRVFEMLKRL
jgi:hypothetical protein